MDNLEITPPSNSNHSRDSTLRTARAFGEGDRQSGEGVLPGAGAGGAALTYQIIATGKGMPIEESVVRLTSSGADAEPWGVDRLFKRSFREKDKGTFRARLGKSRFPIRKLYGPALPKELAKGASATTFYLATNAFVPQAILG